VLSAANQVFAVELCCPKRIRFSLSILCCLQQIRFSLLNCVFHSESGVHCRIVYSAVNQVFAVDWVLFAANQVFTIKSCCPQRIRCLVSNCVFRSKSGVHCRTYVVRSELGFVAKVVFRSKSGICYRIVSSAANQVFAGELVLSAGSQMFAAELVWSATNQVLVAESVLYAAN